MLVGTLMAFDKHMNLVLADTEEYRIVKGKKGQPDREQKRTIGFILLRGENVVSLSAEAPPPPKPRAETILGRGGPGVGRQAGRGMPVAPGAPPMGFPGGLAAPVAGVGGPGHAAMQPGMVPPPPGAAAAGVPGRGMGMPMMGAGAPPPPMMMMGRGRGFPPPPPGQ